jgi:hypothetical protein
MKNMNTYILDLCRQLHFGVHAEGGRYTFSVPEGVQDRFLHRESFTLREDEFTKEHPYIRTLLSLWSESCPFPFLTSDGEEAVYFAYKTSIRNHFVEEYITVYRYEPATHLVTVLPLDSFHSLIQSSRPLKKAASLEVLKRAETRATERVRKDAITHMKEKQEEWKPILQKEIRRIQEYYVLVKQEHVNSFTEHTYTDYEVMASEKDQLIKRQMEKYRYRLDDVTIEPLLVLYTF